MLRHLNNSRMLVSRQIENAVASRQVKNVCVAGMLVVLWDVHKTAGHFWWSAMTNVQESDQCRGPTMTWLQESGPLLLLVHEDLVINRMGDRWVCGCIVVQWWSDLGFTAPFTVERTLGGDQGPLSSERRRLLF